uniref:Uncharacterized protein n=1 Tax=Mycena chlorophos TaxID=658473 RepID=A0ABQ0LZR0_MYCCL|nr:predicted protein [Mycena chlorophos]
MATPKINYLAKVLLEDLTPFRFQEEVIKRTQDAGGPQYDKTTTTNIWTEQDGNMGKIGFARRPSNDLKSSFDAFCASIEDGKYPPGTKLAGQDIPQKQLDSLKFLDNEHFTRVVLDTPQSEQDVRNNFFANAVNVVYTIADLIPGIFDLVDAEYNVQISAESNIMQQVEIPKKGTQKKKAQPEQAPVQGLNCSEFFFQADWEPDIGRVRTDDIFMGRRKSINTALQKGTQFLRVHHKSPEHQLTDSEKEQPVAYLVLEYKVSSTPKNLSKWSTDNFT